MTHPIHVDEGTFALLKEHAESRQITVREAARRLVASGAARLAALAKHRKRPAAEEPSHEASRKLGKTHQNVLVFRRHGALPKETSDV